MGILRNRIAYRRANAANAECMADIREIFSEVGDHLENLLNENTYVGDPSELGEFRRAVALMLTDLENASRHAIKAVLLQTGAPIDQNPRELHYRAPETDS